MTRLMAMLGVLVAVLGCGDETGPNEAGSATCAPVTTICDMHVTRIERQCPVTAEGKTPEDCSGVSCVECSNTVGPRECNFRNEPIGCRDCTKCR